MSFKGFNRSVNTITLENKINWWKILMNLYNKLGKALLGWVEETSLILRSLFENRKSRAIRKATLCTMKGFILRCSSEEQMVKMFLYKELKPALMDVINIRFFKDIKLMLKELFECLKLIHTQDVLLNNEMLQFIMRLAHVLLVGVSES